MAKPSVITLLPPVIFIAVAGLMLAGMFFKDADQIPTALAGQPAPGLPQDPLPGYAPFTDEVLTDGQVKLVNYWASWCGPCRVEHPNLQLLADQGLPIYGVNYKDQPSTAVRFLDELGNPYTGIVTDQSGRIGLDWGVYGVPETFVIDKDGTVLGRVAGPVTSTTMEQRLRPLLESAGVFVQSE